MKRLSSKFTFFHKKIFPVLWFGGLGIFLCVGLAANVPTRGPGIMFFVMPILMAAIGWFIMKKLVWDLMDEVYDFDTSLLFRNNGQDVRVSLKDIKNVSYSLMTNPPRVTLSIRYQTDFGNELTFAPPISWIPFRKNRDIEDLIDRIDKARG